MYLSDIPGMQAVLKTEKSHKIKLLHRVIFNEDGDRKNRQRLRQFSGFSLAEDSEEFHTKVKQIKKDFEINELISIANILCIDSSGAQDDLVNRIVSYLNNLELLKSNVILEEEENDSDLEDEDGHAGENNENYLDELTTRNNSGTPPRRQLPFQSNETDDSNAISGAGKKPDVVFCKYNMNISIDDIKSFVAEFDGQSHENVQSWIESFEDAASILQLNELQKLIFAKRLMTGKARLFLLSESKLNSWKQFKDAVIEEFESSCNSAELHELLSKQKMKSNETIDEFFLNMKRIAKNGQIEDVALMRYVIDGIPGSAFKKSCLYGTKTLTDFKSKLKLFQQLCDDEEKSKASKPKFEPKQKSDFRNRSELKNFGNQIKRDNMSSVAPRSRMGRNLTCFNCGESDHISKFCVHKDKGSKCFRCKEFGHRSFECPKISSKPEVAAINLSTDSKLRKVVKINNVHVTSLIDTGSQATLLRKSIFDKMNVNKLLPVNSTLSGFGKCQVKPLGHFTSNVEIDDFQCSADIFVVENHVMTHECILGLNVLLKGEMLINDQGVIIQNKSQNVEETNLISVLPVEIDCNEDEINIDSSVPNCYKNTVQQLVSNYVPLKTKSTDIELKICVKNDGPISHQPRRLPFSEKKIVETQMTEWLKSGVIEPSSSEYSSPLVIVKKKDGTPRVCIDYRRLNKIVVKDRFPLPLIEDILDRLQEARIFSTIDLKNGFFHVDVGKDSRKYTSFVTHEGQYQFLKVPFGLCNSPAVFQRFINTIFRPLVKDGIVLPYMDDVIILSASLEEGVERLRQVLNLASEHGLEINFKKSHFLKSRIDFLGHVIEEGKIFPSTLKTQAVLKFPEPSNLKQIQSFLGLTGYFRKFIPRYSIIAKPLSDLLKKNQKFEFGEEQKAAFARLKLALVEKPVLTIYNPHYETELHTDASLEGYGAILMQKLPGGSNFHPTYFMSRKTSDAEKKYSSYELEVLAVIEALKKFRVYLLGIPFKIVTDCSAFQKTMEKRDLATRVARWALLLQEFDYIIEHRSGVRMPHVDALSRALVSVLCISVENAIAKLKLAQENDTEIKTTKELLKVSSYENYIDRNGILYKFSDGKELIVVPESMQTEIIKDAHDKGHTGIKYTEKHLEDYYYIPKLRQKVEKVIANCVHCILVNRKSGKKEGLLHPRFKEDVPLHTYHIDHLGPLESTRKNYKHILVIVDAFTKFVWIYPTKSTTSAEVIAKLENQKVTFGSPYQIISDRGSAFTSSEFTDYCAKENIRHHLITTGLPRANGQVERTNQVIISVLAKLSLEQPAEWYKHTSEVQRTINSTYQRSIDTTPFELIFGTGMNSKGTDQLKKLIESEFQSQFESQREELRKHAKKQIFQVQQENRKTYNLRRKEARPYKVGDFVAIKRTQFGPHLKLRAKFFGPYKITKIKGGNTYDVIKEGYHEGPICTTTCAEFMKNWTTISEQ